MPIYEYQCQGCGHELEKLQKISDEQLTVCPACGEPSLKRKISAAGFRLKGGGWYETDFKKSGGKKNLAGEAGSSGTSGGDKPAAGGESKSTASSTPAGAGSAGSA